MPRKQTVSDQQVLYVIKSRHEHGLCPICGKKGDGCARCGRNDDCPKHGCADNMYEQDGGMVSCNNCNESVNDYDGCPARCIPFCYKVRRAVKGRMNRAIQKGRSTA